MSNTSDPQNQAPQQQPTDHLEENLDQAAQSTKEKIHHDPAKGQTLAPTAALQDEIIDIEKELLNAIITRLENNNMSAEEAQQLAQQFLTLLPVADQKDLLTKLYKLSQTNNAAKSIYIEYMKPHEENERQKKLTLISQHLHQGNIEEALGIAKKNNEWQQDTKS